MFMFKKSFALMVVLCFAAMFSTFARAEEQPKESGFRIDIHSDINEMNVVFNLDQPSFIGDMPYGLKYMGDMQKRMASGKGKGKIIGVYSGQAAYMILNDETYNKVRKVTTGNPYREVIARLVKDGVQIEACGNTMKNNGWDNADILPGILVNDGALARIVSLANQGYVQLRP